MDRKPRVNTFFSPLYKEIRNEHKVFSRVQDLTVLFFGSYLGFDHTATLFHIRDSPVEPVDRPIFLTNAFSFDICIHNVSLPEEANTMFKVSVIKA